jgi:MarR-like DNA-binding transcriptional regulator SgrR of sgrS sRNA
MLVLRYLNDNLLDVEFASICHFLADKDNGFVTFFIKSKVLHNMIKEVLGVGDTPPKNRIRKVIFKPYTLLTLSEKLSIVGKLIGRGKKIVEDDIYECMLSLNNEKQKITINKIAESLGCSTRTIYRNMGNQLKLEKELLNSEL